MGETLLRVEDLHVRYGRTEAVRGVSFSLDAGSMLAIVGESGSGKSTVAKAVMGLLKPSAGRIERKAKSVQMVFQDAVGSLNPRMTARQTLAEVLKVKGRGGGHTPESLMEMVGLPKAALGQYPHEMSGGQCQRVSIARALACSPDALVADEPVSALDVSVQARILNLLRDLRRDFGLAILLVAHDLAVVKNVCEYVHVMEKGVFVESGPADVVLSRPSSEYARRLLAAAPAL